MHQEIKVTAIWLVLAFFLTFAGFWQAKVVIARDFQARHQALPPPAKTKNATRPQPAEFTGDVVADYVARCEKGMTDQEIGWILEDFQNAGLGGDLLGPNRVHLTRDELAGRHKEFFDLRAAQHRWYLGALVDGFRLNPEQSAVASKRLSDLFDLAKTDFIEAFNAPLAGQESEAEWKTVAAQHPVEELITSNRWLNDQELAFIPWNLCPLTPAQEKLTWKSWMDKSQEERSAITELAEATLEKQAAIGNLAETTREPDNDPLTRILPYPPRTWGELGHTVLLAPVYFYSANVIFPFLDRQKFPPMEGLLKKESGENFLTKFRALHPAQLKVLLLMQPELIPTIERALNGDPLLESETDPFAE